VPCNPNALQEAKSAGIDTGPLREWASRLLDDGGQVLVPRNLLEETFRQAKTPRTVRQKYLAKSETPDWKVGAARICRSSMMQTAGMAPRLPSACLTPPASTATARTPPRRPRLPDHDAANPMLRGSYKLPFADIVGGELKAIKGGISAAKGRSTRPMPRPPCSTRRAPSSTATTRSSHRSTEKSGRRISAPTRQSCSEAMDHHESATKCIKDVLASNESDEHEPDDDPDNLIVDPPKCRAVTESRSASKASRRAKPP
jgi:hypothetical protein